MNQDNNYILKQYEQKLIPVIILSIGFLQTAIVGLTGILYNLFKKIISKKNIHKIIVFLLILNFIIIACDYIFITRPLVIKENDLYNTMQKYVATHKTNLGYNIEKHKNLIYRFTIEIIIVITYLISKLTKKTKSKLYKRIILLSIIFLTINIIFIIKNYESLIQVRETIDFITTIEQNYPNTIEMFKEFFR